jgi:hypothetical protein
MNGKGFGRNQSWPTRGTHPDICLERLGKTARDLRIADVPTEIRTLTRPVPRDGAQRTSERRSDLQSLLRGTVAAISMPPSSSQHMETLFPFPSWDREGSNPGSSQ